jgi:dienelactone hydrolase
MSYSRETIKIPSKDPNVLLDVWLFTPTSSPKPHPVVVAGHGCAQRSTLASLSSSLVYRLTLTKDAGYEALCERWASDAGFASLVLDYRGFGASGGTPRNVLSPAMQTEDYKAVIAWARKHPEPFRLDKIVVMGSAMSGLSVAQLAVEDQKLAGAIAQCPVLDGVFCP